MSSDSRPKGNVTARVASCSLTLVLAFLAAFADSPPDATINPQSGLIETADTPWAGTNYNIRHAENLGGGQYLVTTLSTNALDDLGGRIAINSSGNTWVTWWRDDSTDQVLVRRRSYSDKSWGSERQVGSSSESARNPAIACLGTIPWIAYEFTASGGTSVAVSAGGDDYEPWPSTRTVLRTTSYSGSLDTRIQSESGRLWVTWVDSSSNVGWSSYNSSNQTWSSASYESYASDSVAAARGRIRTTVLGN